MAIIENPVIPRVAGSWPETLAGFCVRDDEATALFPRPVELRRRERNRQGNRDRSTTIFFAVEYDGELSSDELDALKADPRFRAWAAPRTSY